MKLLFALGCALALVAATAPVDAQNTRPADRQANQDRQGSTQFDDHARQTAHDWYSQHQNRPPVGFRSQDRLSPDQESRLQPGRPLDPDLQKRTHAVPRDLSRQLPQPPSNHRYVAIGGHVGLVDDASHILRDIIKLHD